MTQPNADLNSLPATLKEWRSAGFSKKGDLPRNIWNPLAPFFESLGYKLWIIDTPDEVGFFSLKPPNENERMPDAFSYRTWMNDPDPYRLFDQVKAIHCPARTEDNRDVLIRLISKGDQGLNHLKTLRKIACGHIAMRGENHVLPVLREITLEDMIFVVFPLVESEADVAFYYQLHELLDEAAQLLEGLVFLHENLIAHLDIDIDNILLNFAGGPNQMNVEEPLQRFRSYFPVRYYLNDFEFSVCFDPASDPSTRLVTGLPISTMLDPSKYGREKAPEMLTDKPYCPFRTDVWQLGRMLLERSAHVDVLPTEVRTLFENMTSEDPGERPTSADALKRLRMLRSEIPSSVLNTVLERMPPHEFTESELPDVPWAEGCGPT